MNGWTIIASRSCQFVYKCGDCHEVWLPGRGDMKASYIRTAENPSAGMFAAERYHWSCNKIL